MNEKISVLAARKSIATAHAISSAESGKTKNSYGADIKVYREKKTNETI